jgi:hypothetical protein
VKYHQWITIKQRVYQSNALPVVLLAPRLKTGFVDEQPQILMHSLVTRSKPNEPLSL